MAIRVFKDVALKSCCSSCILIRMSFSAWWIAFGPHGPRAETPPGEWSRIFLYTGIGVAVSVVLFTVIHSFARPPPRTMTKEWQEATNEYLKVRFHQCWRALVEATIMVTDKPLVYRKKDPIPSMVSAARATAARVMYRASPRRSIEHKLHPHQHRLV